MNQKKYYFCDICETLFNIKLFYCYSCKSKICKECQSMNHDKWCISEHQKVMNTVDKMTLFLKEKTKEKDILILKFLCFYPEQIKQLIRFVSYENKQIYKLEIHQKFISENTIGCLIRYLKLHLTNLERIDFFIKYQFNKSLDERTKDLQKILNNNKKLKNNKMILFLLIKYTHMRIYIPKNILVNIIFEYMDINHQKEIQENEKVIDINNRKRKINKI